MPDSARSSYGKTIALLATAGVAASIAAVLGVSVLGLSGLVVLPLVAAAAGAGVCCLGGLVCLWRDADERAGRDDAFERAANRVPGGGGLSRLGLRALLGRRMRPGDRVAVRSLDDIRATLDAEGQLDALPFMREMEPFAGRVFRVHRRLDKINDMRNKTGLRRVRDAVTLTGVRCSGSDHGGCQAECQIIWKDAWLRPATASESAAATPRGAPPPPAHALPDGDGDAERTYLCQMTRLWEASEPMSPADPRMDLRALLWGNIGLGGFLLGLLTRIFGRVQRARGGVGYPYMPASPSKGPTPAPVESFDAGDRVVVRSKQEIAETLVASRNKGLWYDRDMIRFSGREAVVRRRVHRVIDERSGRMVTMRTPAVVLEDVVGTGEFLRFCAQHEYLFWREVWLRRV